MGVSNATLRRTLILLIIVGSALCVGLSAYLILHKPTTRLPSPAIHALATPKAVQGVRKTVNAGLPARLKIPKINVDAVLDHVGLTPNGDLDAPKDPANAAWYDQGPRPGDSGNAIIDGHFGYKSNQPAVFDDLHTLRTGDSLHVIDDKGVATYFVVRELRSYDPNEDTSDVFRPSDGKAHLNLITCKGSWDKKLRAYSARLVVFADKITE